METTKIDAIRPFSINFPEEALRRSLPGFGSVP